MNLYLRLLKVLFAQWFVRRRQPVLASLRLRFRVWPNDCDLNFHVNNGRYLTFMDLGRIDMFGRTGLLRASMRRRWAPVLGAAEISFIRPLSPWQRFELTTRLLGWDAKYFYFEHRFEAGGRLCALAHVKGLFLAGHEAVAPAAVAALVGAVDTPPLPQVITDWNALLALKRNSSEA